MIEDRQQDDRDPEVRDQRVELGEYPADGRYSGSSVMRQPSRGRPSTGTVVGDRTHVRFRYGVDTARIPRVATQETSCRQPGAPQGAVARQRLEGVRGAGRVEAASGRQPAADQPPAPDREPSTPGPGRRRRHSGVGLHREPGVTAGPGRRAAAAPRSRRGPVGHGHDLTARTEQVRPPGLELRPAPRTASRRRRRARLRSPRCRPPGRSRTRPGVGPRHRDRARCGPTTRPAGPPGRGPARRRSHGRGSARSGGETLAAAGPARLEHRAAAAGAHPEPETVGFLALPVVGLERALHAWPPLRPRPEGGGRAVVEREPVDSSGGFPHGHHPAPLAGVRLVGSPNAVLRSASRPSTRPRPRRHFPAGAWPLLHRPASSAGEVCSPRPIVLHICGRACGQPRIWPPAADDIWDRGARAIRAQLAEATWNTWFQGVRPLALDDDVLVLGVPSIVACERIRSSYSGMLDDTLKDATGRELRVELLVDTEARADEPVRLGALPDDRAHAGRATAPAQRDDLGAGDAQSPLHLRPVRHRCVEPLRARRRAVRRRGARPGLQPAVHLRARRSRQDPPPARDRPPRAHHVRQEAGPVHVDRVVHERLRRGDP